MPPKPATDKKASKASVNVKKTFRVFAVNFCGPALEAFGKQFASYVETGTRKKILGVTYKVPAGAAGADESKHWRLIVDAAEKKKRQLETGWKNVTTDMESELRSYWGVPIQEEKTDSRHIKLDSIPENSETPERRPSTRASGSIRGSRNSAPAFPKVPAIPQVCVIPKLITEENMRTLYGEIELKELDLRDYFVVIFGKITQIIINDLLNNNSPIQALINFIPCTQDDLATEYPDFHNDLENFKKNENTKTMAIIVQPLLAPQEHFDLRFFPQIYDQFTWFLYDIEMLAQQYFVYKNEFGEINDSLASEHQMARPSVGQAYMKDSSDDTAVCVYLDNLCNDIENPSSKQRRYSSLHHRPFLDNDYDRIIVEEANKLLQSAIATRMNMVSYWRVVDVLVNTLKGHEVCNKKRENEVHLPRHYELLSWESFAQRLQDAKVLSDDCCRCDLTVKCKLYILRKTFNKIITKKTRYRLPTKLCMRDFCEYIAPDIPQLIQERKSPIVQVVENENDKDKDVPAKSSLGFQLSMGISDRRSLSPEPPVAVDDNDLPMFSGLTFDDTLQELYVTEEIYRFDYGHIRCTVENWLHKEKKMTLQLRLFDAYVYVHRWDEFPAKFSRIRIITKTQIVFNIEMLDDISMSSISIQWPNDCQIRYICENGGHGVEQRYHWKRATELKRVFTPRGSVLHYRTDDIIEVLTPNGVFYKLYPTEVMGEEEEESKDYRPPVPVDVTEELAFVKRLVSYGIYCMHFEVTRTNGKKLRIQNGVAVEEIAHYLIYEWTDFKTKEIYVERDDGVRMVWSHDGLRCCYPCGTVITTTVMEDFIEVNLDCHSRSTESILRKMNPTLAEKVMQNAQRRDLYINYEQHFIIQHKNYASVGFYGDEKMVIYSPMNVKLVLLEQSLVVVDIGEVVSFRITSGNCTILSSGTKNKNMLIRLNLLPTDAEVLFFQNDYAVVVVKSNGEMTHMDENEGRPSHTEEKYFLAKKYKFAMAFFSEKEYRTIISEFTDKTYKYITKNKVVLFKPIRSINHRYSMPMPEVDKKLENFWTPCTKVQKEEEELMERILSARTILTVDEIPDDMCKLIQNLYFIEGTLGRNLDEALEYFLGGKKKKPKHSWKWRKKLREARETLEYQHERMPIYNEMLRHKVFPKYHVYNECDGELRNLNVDSVLPRLQKYLYHPK